MSKKIFYFNSIKRILQFFCFFSFFLFFFPRCVPSTHHTKLVPNTQLVQQKKNVTTTASAIKLLAKNPSKHTTKKKESSQEQQARKIRKKAKKSLFFQPLAYLQNLVHFFSRSSSQKKEAPKGGGALAIIPKKPSNLFDEPTSFQEKSLASLVKQNLHGLTKPKAKDHTLKMPTHRSFRWLLRYHKRKYWSYTRAIFRRGSLYGKTIRKIFRERGIPEELFLQAGAETAFKTRVNSPAGAGGIWQFISRTGRRYGLAINQWKDERRDVVKSSKAAAQYLYDLYQKFGKWEWAVAAYNCGEPCVEWVQRRCPKMSFWDVRRRLSCKLPPETSFYVAKIFSLIHFHRKPELFKKCLKHYPEVRSEKITTNTPLNLMEVAKAIRLPLKELWHLNPELSYWATPPGESYQLLVPPGFKERWTTFLKHRKQTVRLTSLAVKPGQKLAKIARKYRMETKTLQRINRIWGAYIPSRTKFLLLPLPAKGTRWGRKQLRHLRALESSVRSFARRFRYARQSRPRGVCYRVKKSDSYGKISRRFRIPLTWLRRYNNKLGKLRTGTILKLRKWARCRVHRKRKKRKKSKTLASLDTNISHLFSKNISMPLQQ